MPPEESTTPNPAAETPSETPPVETPPAAQTVTVSREDWDRINAQLAHMGGQIAGMAATAGRQAPPPAPPPRQYADDELAEMLESGDGRKILMAQRIISHQALAPVVGEFNQFREATMVTAESLGREVVEATGKIPFYKDPDIKRQVDAFLATLPMEARANKESLVLAHNYVVGMPDNVERIVKQRMDEERRKAAGTPQVADTTARGGRVPDSSGNTVPTVTELLGDGAAVALRRQGRSPDEFAKRQGYKNWAAYAKMVQETTPADDADNEELT